MGATRADDFPQALAFPQITPPAGPCRDIRVRHQCFTTIKGTPTARQAARPSPGSCSGLRAAQGITLNDREVPRRRRPG